LYVQLLIKYPFIVYATAIIEGQAVEILNCLSFSDRLQKSGFLSLHIICISFSYQRYYFSGNTLILTIYVPVNV